MKFESVCRLLIYIALSRTVARGVRDNYATASIAEYVLLSHYKSCVGCGFFFFRLLVRQKVLVNSNTRSY